MILHKITAAAAALFLILSLCFPLFAPAPVRAEENPESGYGYARVTQEDVYLYSQPQAESGLFILPRTYFVKITGETGDYYRVEYLTGTSATPVRGYCRTDDVDPVDYIPETPFLLYDTEVTFTVGSADLPDGFFTEYTVPAAFYGTFYYGSSVYYYVNMNGEFGYVPASACPPLDYPENTICRRRRPKRPRRAAETPTPSTSSSSARCRSRRWARCTFCSAPPNPRPPAPHPSTTTNNSTDSLPRAGARRRGFPHTYVCLPSAPRRRARSPAPT